MWTLHELCIYGSRKLWMLLNRLQLSVIIYWTYWSAVFCVPWCSFASFENLRFGECFGLTARGVGTALPRFPPYFNHCMTVSRDVKSHYGAWDTFLWSPSGKILLNGAFLLNFIFFSDGRSPKHRRAHGNLPPLKKVNVSICIVHLAYNTSNALFVTNPSRQLHAHHVQRADTG